MTYSDSDIFTEGVFAVLPDGAGFLRSSDNHYLPAVDDVYVSDSLVTQFHLRTGDIVSGRVRPA